MRLKEHVDLPTRRLNRLAKRTPAGGLFWCDHCDRNHVGNGEKCSLCGHRNGRRRMRKSDV